MPEIRKEIPVSHFSEFDFSLTGDSRKRPESEMKASRAKRERTLAGMGIVPLSPYDSAMMAGTVPPGLPKIRPGKGNWRDTPRKRAKMACALYYVSDRVCNKNHLPVKRYTSTGQCVACVIVWHEIIN